MYRRDARADLARLHELGVDLLVLLVEDHELERWGDPALVEHAQASASVSDGFPFATATHAASVTDVDELLDEIRDARAGSDVVVACMGGIGRSGTIAACALVAAGQSPDRAIAHLRAVRHPTAVETRAQVAFVGAYAAHREDS